MSRRPTFHDPRHEEQRRRTREYRIRKRAAGICIDCGQPAADGRMCTYHHDKLRAYGKARYQNQLQQGLCVLCGKAPRMGLLISCSTCTVIRRQHTRKPGIECARCGQDSKRLRRQFARLAPTTREYLREKLAFQNRLGHGIAWDQFSRPKKFVVRQADGTFLCVYCHNRRDDLWAYVIGLAKERPASKPTEATEEKEERYEAAEAIELLVEAVMAAIRGSPGKILATPPLEDLDQPVRWAELDPEEELPDPEW